MRLTAKVSKNYRDVATGAPKVLLRSICINDSDEGYRDHAWVELTPELKKLVNSIKDNRSILVTMQADEKQYEYRTGVVKRTLTNVRNIRVLGRA